MEYFWKSFEWWVLGWVKGEIKYKFLNMRLDYEVISWVPLYYIIVEIDSSTGSEWQKKIKLILYIKYQYFFSW